MASSDISQESSDWEEVQYPYGDQPSDSSPKAQRLHHELVVRENFYDEGLAIEPDECDSPKNTTPIAGSGTDPPQQQQRSADSKLSMIVGQVRAKMRMVWEKMPAFVGTSSGSLIAPATALAVAVFAWVRILQWRKQVVLLMREKDQRIGQLLDQIAHMREILSARRMVPVLRIN